MSADDDMGREEVRLLPADVDDALATWGNCLARLNAKFYSGATTSEALPATAALMEANRKVRASIAAAIAAERVAAGLDAPAKPAVDREGLAKVLRAAEFAHDAHLLAKYPWETLTPSCRDNYIARADAAIRFLGGAS